jgi:hypothetical protein
MYKESQEAAESAPNCALKVSIYGVQFRIGSDFLMGLLNGGHFKPLVAEFVELTFKLICTIVPLITLKLNCTIVALMHIKIPTLSHGCFQVDSILTSSRIIEHSYFKLK